MTEHTASRRTLLAGTLGGSALGGLVLASSDAAEAITIPTDPSSDFFLAIDGIPGDSLDARLPKTIEVLDWSWGVSSAISPTNTGGGAGKSKPRPFTFVARTSSASPKLFLACAKGTHIPSATLTARRVGDLPFVYLTIKLQNLFVTSYQVAPAPTDAYPLDVAQLEYGAVTITYTPQKQDGSAGAKVTAGFDFIKNLAT
jgi:type VI secretion system secreted protein Hcp